MPNIWKHSIRIALENNSKIQNMWSKSIAWVSTFVWVGLSNSTWVVWLSSVTWSCASYVEFLDMCEMSKALGVALSTMSCIL